MLLTCPTVKQWNLRTLTHSCITGQLGLYCFLHVVFHLWYFDLLHLFGYSSSHQKHITVLSVNSIKINIFQLYVYGALWISIKQHVHDCFDVCRSLCWRRASQNNVIQLVSISISLASWNVLSVANPPVNDNKSYWRVSQPCSINGKVRICQSILENCGQNCMVGTCCSHAVFCSLFITLNLLPHCFNQSQCCNILLWRRMMRYLSHQQTPCITWSRKRPPLELSPHNVWEGDHTSTQTVFV